MFLQAEPREQIQATRPHFLVAEFPQRAHRQRHVVEGGEFREQEMELEDEAERLEPKLRADILVHPRGGLAEDEDIAGGGRIQQAQKIHQRGFARARGAGDGHEFPRMDRKVDVAHEGGVDLSAQHAGRLPRLDEGRHEAPRMISTGFTLAAFRAGSQAAMSEAPSAISPARP